MSPKARAELHRRLLDAYVEELRRFRATWAIPADRTVHLNAWGRRQGKNRPQGASAPLKGQIMIIDSQLTFGQVKQIRLTAGNYSNGRMALTASDPETGEPIAKLTVNVPHANLAPGEILLKDWGENEGASDTLLAAGLIEPTDKEVICGFELAKVYRWLGGAL